MMIRMMMIVMLVMVIVTMIMIPILVTLVGIVTDFSAVHPEKAPSPDDNDENDDGN
jgi:hypothetical protein